jgi:hypothetical protein
MFKAGLVTVRDPFNPWRSRGHRVIEGPAPIRSLVPETRQPFIVLRNGEVVLRADWDQPVADGDLLAVVLLPQGGDGGSDVLRVVLMIVVAVVAWYYAPALAGAFGGTSAGAVGVAQAAIGLVGAALVNAMLPPPRASGSDYSGGGGLAASPTYNISAQGNTARLDSAIPVQYGRMQCYPDFAASPYVEYAGNEQYLYQLLCIGVGEYDLEAIRIEDTPIANFEEVEYQVVPPNTPVGLFPTSVVTAVEVSGQEALTATTLGPFTANPAGTTANYLAVDVVCPRGLYYANDDGSLAGKSIAFTVAARPVDDLGAPLGSFVTLGNETLAAATSTPQRYSFRYAMAGGRYEVQLTRTDAKDTSSRAGHELSWAGLRAYLLDAGDFGNVTLLAVKMRATNNLSSQSSRKINVIATRRLYHWTGASWVGPAATRSIADALADACHTVGLPDARIDLAALLALHATWAARGDSFDARFDSTDTFWEAITKIARAGRCKAFMQGGIMRFARDEPMSLPVALYSMRNILRGSFSIDFMTPSEDTADAVEVSYFDESTWKPRRLRCKLAGSVAARPAKVDLFGVVNREQAYREGLYMAAANRYRRTIIKFSTEMEGFIPSFGDLIAVSHDLPQWGQQAEVVAWDAGTREAILSEPMTWGGGSHYLGLRRRDGSVSGPYAVTAGADAYRVVLAVDPDFTPYVGGNEERTHAVFGWGETWRQLARVVSVRPRNETTVELVCVNEDGSVHTADQGVTAPAVNYSQLPPTPSAPAIVGLDARSMPGSPTDMLITWQPSPGAEYYIVEQSADGMAWTRIGETRANNMTATAIYGSQTIIRLAAVGQLRGAWVSFNYALAADYMWAATESTPMWSVDGNMMWRY